MRDGMRRAVGSSPGSQGPRGETQGVNRTRFHGERTAPPSASKMKPGKMKLPYGTLSYLKYDVYPGNAGILACCTR